MGHPIVRPGRFIFKYLRGIPLIKNENKKNSRRCAAKSGLPVNNGRASLQRAGNGGTNGK
ncbi:hypothetical protein ASJ35_10195 [Ruthenibacterium lactatiformans]|uniref:Uncharacterized protein n=1 Tax=Ruthenibacterium lactatiformans TaxID=1550024 RepID=A0A0W7TQP9_9FIRM|nr:hypothetical protein ASJ35_10195 [Ruthenibacterium lactatiformans]